MSAEAFSIGELADAAGLTRRAIRFYVQQKLLPPPDGRGRGRHYDAGHLARLRWVIDLQSAGHSLDAIRTLLAGPTSRGTGGRASRRAEPSDAAPPGQAAPPPPAALRAELWTRVRIGDGIELAFDATRHRPTVEQLLALRQQIRDALL